MRNGILEHKEDRITKVGIPDLEWILNVRKEPYEAFGCKSIEEWKSKGKEITQTYEGQERIPEQIGSTFSYKLKGAPFYMSLFSQYYQTSVLSKNVGIYFEFKNKMLPDALKSSLQGIKGFNYQNKSRVKLIRKNFSRGGYFISMQDEGLDLWCSKGSFTGPNQFTDRGNNFMNWLIKNSDKLCSVQGILDQDKYLVMDLFACIKDKYETGKIEPTYWHRT